MSMSSTTARRSEWWDRVRLLQEMQHRAWPFQVVGPQDLRADGDPRDDPEREVEYL